jgi:selenocysteine lyase/cysteine desulfurase
MTKDLTNPNYPDLFTGIDVKIPLLDGSHRRYINLDNAASTPPFKAVQTGVNDFLDYYSSVHRGTGFKSQISTHAYETSRQAVLQFVGGEPDSFTCILVNATEALNKLARRFPFTPQRDIVLTSGMEHHSNDLPWRAVSKVIHVGLHPDGRLDEADFDMQLAKYSDRVALVAISGASNVTGYLNPIHRLAEKAHAVGAQIAVDCAQLAPHRKIEMGSLEDPARLDYIAISAHKLYALRNRGISWAAPDFRERQPDLQVEGQWKSSP